MQKSNIADWDWGLSLPVRIGVDTMAKHSTRSELLRPRRSGGRFTWVAALTTCALLGAMAQASAREHQLAGIRLGRPANQVTELFGDPTRTFTGVPTGGQAGMPGAEGMGVPGMAPGGPAMPGMEAGMAGDPMMGMAPGGMGGGMGIPVPPPQKYEGKIAAMKPEEFIGRLLAAPAAAAPAGGDPQMGMAPGAMPDMDAGMPGMPGMPGGAPAQSTAPPTPKWIYERSRDSATFVFGFDEDGRINLVVVGDDKPYSITRGGRKPPFAGAKTAKGIGLGADFKSVILAYGFPESTEILGDEVLLKYFERHGVAFTFRQNFMKVTSIAIKSPEE